MGNVNRDKKPDFLPDIDRGEQPRLMEPLLLAGDSWQRAELLDLTVDLAARCAALRSSLPTGIRAALGDLVRAMNCYYSNLIEGHTTHPIDIEKALHGDYSNDRNKRNLQLEAQAHIGVQRWIDEGGLVGRVLTGSGIREIHRRFCEHLPEELLWVEHPGLRVKVVPGELRRYDVQVGGHIAISAGSLSRFFARFEEIYGRLGKAETVLAAAAAHHRLLWIHPFLDGNGRVARLMSYGQLWEVLETGGVWSIARGLARNETEYKQHLMSCDEPRQSDLDGRGNLSEKALSEFTRFFLRVCIDQVEFMEKLTQPSRLRERILRWATEEIDANKLPFNSGLVLEALLYRGELPRREVPHILGVGERQGNRVVSALMEHSVVTSSSHRAPLRICFPATVAGRWMPGLFPDAAAS